MSANHDLQAKALFDKFLNKARNNDLSRHPGSVRLVHTRSSKTFPSPDAVFYDEEKFWMTSCEFKPETETKRGILTGLGQCVSYLEEANLAYLAIPEIIEDFRMSEYMSELFEAQVAGKLPIGLIVFPNSEPEKFEIRVPITTQVINNNSSNPTTIAKRPWAKIQDLPLEIVLEILRYFLKNDGSGKTANEIFSEFWINSILEQGAQISSLEIPSVYKFKYHYGKSLELFSKKKNLLAKKVKDGEITLDNALESLKNDLDPNFVGDNYAVSYRKNWLTAMYHLDLVSPSGQMLDDGLKLFKIGSKFGGSSQPMIDEFTRLVLTNGKHLSVILDFESFQLEQSENFRMSSDLVAEFVKMYDRQGKIKWNQARRQNSGQNEQLRYEQILWNKLQISMPSIKSTIPFNWRRITSLLSS